jgi:phospholipid/cholesterol/gamma-HCH transport system ATP-binding protein
MPISRVDPSAAARPILSAQGLHIASRGALPALSIDLVLNPGELHVIHTRHKERSRDIADALLGLGGPDAGVRFLDRAWHELGVRDAFELRRDVGRVQSRGNWMETRPVMDSLLMPVLHHTILPVQRLRNSASGLARRFGLPGLPMQTPDECAAADLERAACVRAFLGRPALVVLEHPMELEASSLLVPLMNAIQQVRRRRGAVLWFTEHLSQVTDPGLSADRRSQLVDTELIELGAAR